MPDYLHRTTLNYQTSVSPNSLPEPIGNYVESPDMSPVAGEPSKYWVLSGDILSLMNQSVKDVVDAEELQALKDTLEAESDVGILKAIIAALIKTINIRLPEGQKITKSEMVTAVRGEL